MPDLDASQFFVSLLRSGFLTVPSRVRFRRYPVSMVLTVRQLKGDWRKPSKVSNGVGSRMAAFVASAAKTGQSLPGPEAVGTRVNL